MEPLIALALGVAAVTLPAGLSVSRSAVRRVAPWAVPAGVLLAMASLVSAMLSLRAMALAGDVAAVLDTTDAYVTCSVALGTLSAAVNVALVRRSRKDACRRRLGHQLRTTRLRGRRRCLARQAASRYR